MMNDEAKRWLEAGSRLNKDPKARVSCPACRGAALQLSDVLGASALERVMSCPKCGARNFVLLSNARTGVQPR